MPAKAPRRAVIDVNIIIRGLLSPTGASAALLEAVRRRRCLLIASRAYLDEIHRVLHRPRFVQRYGITRVRRQRLIARLYTLALLVEPTGRLTLCRDPKDDYLVEMALLGQAAYLVSEDADLLEDPDIVEFLRQHGVELVHVGTFARLLATI
ncbi:MAG: putative toxin-antitoxin system toxin component, PIN family [Chloroflexi bacterium HGW-Chloroflexi-1]|nr:MAG: putative toxin-antitoxin system toxin component, PIN family [Chloroflexi bacterium HGW-Chloroflexi-1]